MRAEAFDDQARPLPSRRFTWFDGRRRLGRGAQVTTRGLAAGRRLLRVEARDFLGRRRSAFVPVRVRAVAPMFLRLTAPKRLSRRARSFLVSVASSQIATLSASGGAVRSVPVGRRARFVRIPVRPGRGALVVVLRLASGSKAITRTLRIPRG